MDIATARGLPLEAVTLAIGKAAQGNIGALGRLGLATRDASGGITSTSKRPSLRPTRRWVVLPPRLLTVRKGNEEGHRRCRRGEEAIGSALIPAFEAAIPIIMDLSKAIGLTAIEFQQWTGSISDQDAAIQTFEAHMGEAADTAAAALTIWKTGGIEFGELLKQLKLGPAELMKLRGATDEFLH